MFDFLRYYKKAYTKSIVISLILLLSFQVTLGQTDKKLTNFYQAKLQKADNYFKASDYISAIECYKEIISKVEDDTSVICKIGDSYRLLNDSKNAEDWYRKAITGNEKTINPTYKWYYAQALTANNKYDEALYWFREYIKYASDDKRALESIKSLENVSELYYDTTFFVVFPLKINTPFEEFSSVYYKRGIVFLSNRASKNTGFFTWYISEPDSSGNLSEPEKFDKSFKTEYNDGPVTFFDHFTKMIFSQNYFKGKVDRKNINEVPLQLFFAKQNTENKWEETTLLPFVNKEYSYSQPSIANNGKTLYFSSNIPGGFGGTDLYVSRYDGSTWSEPQNLGNEINTPGNEMFPFIFQDSVLFFSSNGHGGLGGLDVFKINLKFHKGIRNMGAPINSAQDDFGFILDNDELSGYLSSNRVNGIGGDDLYGFKQIRITVSIKIIDQTTKLPVAGAEVFTMEEDEPLGVTDDDGVCSILIPVCEVFKVKIKKENYETMVYTFHKVKPFSEGIAVIPMQTEQPILLTDENNNEISDTRNVVYKVQIWASRAIPTSKELKRKYHGNMLVSHFYEDNWNKYTIGEFSSYRDAKECLITSDVFDAFIIAYLDNKKVHITIAKDITQETNVKSPITRNDIWINRNSKP